MSTMHSTATVISLDAQRDRRVARAIDVRRGMRDRDRDRRKRARRGGRAWLNGDELGGRRVLDYLGAIHD
jgi:hypothetical protein